MRWVLRKEAPFFGVTDVVYLKAAVGCPDGSVRIVRWTSSEVDARTFDTPWEARVVKSQFALPGRVVRL